jgi:beta-phosphoglucomutase-like phosphatase (HAD superfamily)
MSAPAALLDVDGTLVDTNYHHAIAWYRAFRRHDIGLPLWRIHRHMGMGGDQLIGSLCGDETEGRLGDQIRDAEKDLYMELIDEVEPLPHARDLIDELKRRGHTVVLASSAKSHEVDCYLDLLGAREVVDGWTTSADVERTKPHPDLVAAGVEKAGGGAAVMVGDSTWDCIAAAALRSMAFGEHAAAVVGDGQCQRSAVFELERDVGADELRRSGHVLERQRALDAMQAWNWQS